MAYSSRYEPQRTTTLDRVMAAAMEGRGITLDPDSTTRLADQVSDFVNKFAMAQNRLDIQSRILTAVISEHLSGDFMEIPSEKFEQAQEDSDGFWVYYRPSSDSLLMGLGSVPEGLIEDAEVEAEVVSEDVQVSEVPVEVRESDSDSGDSSPVPEDSEEVGGQA